MKAGDNPFAGLLAEGVEGSLASVHGPGVRAAVDLSRMAQAAVEFIADPANRLLVLAALDICVEDRGSPAGVDRA